MTDVAQVEDLQTGRKTLPRLLLVDDEPSVLFGINRLIRRDYVTTLANSGAQALEEIELAETPFVAVISDMRMPGMNGAELLRRIREVSPETIRILLTGQSDVESIMSAINNGNIFRFLSKPCPLEILESAIHDAVAQHQLILAERELLDGTLRGSVRALLETLSLADPLVFARASRVKKPSSPKCSPTWISLTAGKSRSLPF